MRQRTAASATVLLFLPSTHHHSVRTSRTVVAAKPAKEIHSAMLRVRRRKPGRTHLPDKRQSIPTLSRTPGNDIQRRPLAACCKRKIESAKNIAIQNANRHGLGRCSVEAAFPC